MIRRIELLLVGLLCMAPGLVAQESPDAVATTPETVRLVVWGLGEGESQLGRIAAMNEFERRWNADADRVGEYGRVEVVKSVQGGRMNPQRLMTAIAADAPPDVINQDRFSVGGWAAREAFIPLDDFLAAQDPDDPLTVREDEFYRACWMEAAYAGKVYAIPNSTDDRVLFYNKDLLIAAGYVDAAGEAQPPRTWAELEEYAVALSKWDAAGNLIRVGFIPNYGNSWLYIYGWQNDGKFMSADGRTCTLDDPRIAEALQFMTDVYDAVGGRAVAESFISTFQSGVLDPFLNGKVAMKINGNGEMSNIARYKPGLNWGAAPAPRPAALVDEPVTWSGGFSWAIPRGAPNPEVAWEFIRWMVSEEATLLDNRVRQRYNRARGRLYVPGINANRRINDRVYEDFVVANANLGDNYRRYYKMCVDLMPHSRFRPVTPAGQLLWDEHRRALERATYHQYTPAEALAIGAQEVQKELDRIYEDRSYGRMYWPVAVPALLAIVAVITTVVIGRAQRNRVRTWRPDALREGIAGYAFALPWIGGFLCFTAGPILASILLSVTEYDVLHPAKFVAFRNYTDLLTQDPVFWKSLGNTAFMVLGVPLGMAVGLGLAMLLNTEVKGIAVYRTIFYLPAIVPVVASSVLWIWVFNPESGLLNSALRFTGLERVLTALAKAVGADGLFWLQEERLAKPAIILMGLWSAGSSMIIWLAGLKGIPKHLYEAAEIDGAGRVSRFLHVTLPMLSPYIFFNLIMGVIGTFQIFTQAYIMTQGGPVDATLFYVYYLFNSAFQYFRMGYASAMAWILFGIVLVLTLIQFKLAPRWVHYESGES
ncbi:extracellular solute-binding protein [Candidatus Poribacteria bacterium]|jgi:ABC-type sugar transport system permease subunit/ABC-type glycerol-3-phosphate transport system substrate-binding protein|nr:extracellular solute-binding protein [Candidatus Poribacteria bacterium]MBT5536939.1 extracellular solute-binding protein [Candidatus Poribacteria bacterium]MBT5713245.1 extracellular solute-binding protein [Candidatus Poribacteria bacterium]MBT7805652.1 extracellular solute-binding protein [Candidatus Poribacteria bacterium]